MTAHGEGGGGARRNYASKGQQWGEYDRLARLATARQADHSALAGGLSDGAAALRMIYREEWRIEQEVGALSKITRLDSSMVASGQATIGRCPSGQLAWEGTSAELRGLEEDELGTLYSLVSAELKQNPYLRDGPGGDALRQGTVDKKAQACVTQRQKVQAAIAAASEGDAGAPHRAHLHDSLLAVAQVLHMCEIRLRRERTGTAAAAGSNSSVLWNPAVAALDPFLIVCGQLCAQRRAWNEAMRGALEGDDLVGDPDVEGKLKKLDKAAVTLRKIEAYRLMGYQQDQAAEKKAAQTEQTGPVLPRLAAATPGNGGGGGGPAPSAPSSIPASPVAPRDPVHHTPRTITPALEDPPAPPPAKLPVKAPAKPPRSTARRAIRGRCAAGACPLAPTLAARRVQRWWRRVAYWGRVGKEWRSAHRKASLLEDARWRQRLAGVVASVDATAHPLRRRAALKLQRVVRGWLHGRLPAQRRRRAVAVCQRVFRGVVVRRFRMHGVRQVAQVRRQRLSRRCFEKLAAADARDAHVTDEYVERVLSLTAELRQQHAIAGDEDRRFRREWKEWEEQMNRRVVEEMPLDTSDWSVQTLPDGTKQYLHLKTKKTTTKHPNLQFADIHRKRQWVKVGRVREDRKKQLEARQAKLERVLSGTHAQFEQAIAAMRGGGAPQAAAHSSPLHI
eukprot:TRINITY_DN13609_c0_g1_i1.p1 TRINITY_DN13609_c0_g1~~TRINITY_DN13609_c0_g1_i1.p1  ORF type:complete len:676 (+),score=181.59 TRINITY_DN13609_c0_g1_i1:87-2114(+)